MHAEGRAPSWGLLVDERNLVTDGFKKAVGSRRAVGCVITSVEQKKKLKGKEPRKWKANSRRGIGRFRWSLRLA